MKVSRTRRKHRSTSSTNSAFLVGKRRNRYGWLMPAFRATSSVEVPASPCAANSATAASRTSSRRSAAGILCLVSVMGTKLVMTHYFVKMSDGSWGGGSGSTAHRPSKSWYNVTSTRKIRELMGRGRRARSGGDGAAGRRGRGGGGTGGGGPGGGGGHGAAACSGG